MITECTCHSYKIEQLLTCRKGDWQKDIIPGFLYSAPKTFAYQWQLNGNDIPNAQQKTFEPTTTGLYTCTITASNQAGATSITSRPQKVKWW